MRHADGAGTAPGAVGPARDRDVQPVSTRTASSSWEPGPLRCVVAVGGFSILVDEPEDVGGTGAAPQPTDLLLASVASCFTLALVHSAAKRAITLTSVRVEAVGSYAGPRFDAVRISVDVGGPTPGELADLIVAAERVCYVSNTLRAGADITVAAE